MPDPAGATNYIEITADKTYVPEDLPGAGDTILIPVVIDQAAAVNYEGGIQTFIDELAADYSDLRVFNSDGSVEVQFGVYVLSQVAGSRQLILGLGIPNTAPLSTSADTIYRLYRGCTGGPFENKALAANGLVDFWPCGEASWNGTPGEVVSWTAGHSGQAVGGVTTVAGGPIYRAGSFDGNNDYVSIAADAAAFSIPALGAATLTAWFKTTTLQIREIAGSGSATGDFFTISWVRTTANPNPMRFNLSDRGFWNTSPTNVGSWNDGAWHRVDAVCWQNGANRNALCYIDGVPGALGSAAGNTAVTLDKQWAIGGYFWDAAIAGLWPGSIAEVRYALAARSQNYITTQLNAEKYNGAFWTVGAEQTTGTTYYQECAETATVTDTLSLATTYARTLSETITATDTVSRTKLLILAATLARQGLDAALIRDILDAELARRVLDAQQEGNP